MRRLRRTDRGGRTQSPYHDRWERVRRPEPHRNADHLLRAGSCACNDRPSELDQYLLSGAANASAAIAAAVPASLSPATIAPTLSATISASFAAATVSAAVAATAITASLAASTHAAATRAAAA